jgi:hypothetical protein
MKHTFARIIHHILLMLGIYAVLLTGIAAFTLSAKADNNAMVRVVHASPDAGKVDVFVDGNKLLDNFDFATVTDYVPLSAGSHKIQVAPAGKGADAAVITQTVSANAGVMYSVAALGTKDSGFSLQAFVDDSRVPAGSATVRVYHLSSNAGPVDIETGGNKVITALNYQNASDYLSVPPGDYTFNVTATQANATVPVKATLKDGSFNSVFAVGLYKGTPELKFVLASVAGTPGMPQTGSDPNAVPASTPLLPWLGGIALLLFGIALTVRHFAVARQK